MAHTQYSRRIVAQVLATRLLAEPQHRAHWLQVAAAYLVERKQTDRAGQLIQDIVREIMAQSGVLLASVSVAHELSAVLEGEMADYLARVTGARDVHLSVAVEPELLSGYVVRTPDYEVNTTAQYRLRQLMSLEA